MSKADHFINSAAYRDFKYFTLAMMPDYILADHNRLICKKLMDLESGKIKRLMINVPPRGGKSLLSSQLFPAWYLGRHPDRHVICATYGQSLADDFGRKVRNNLKDERYQTIFPNTKLSDDSAAIKKFDTTLGGGYYAVGAGSSLTGKGCSILILDDTLKNRADANSTTITNNIIDWFKSTAYTRLTPDGAVVILNTRWSEKDLCGYLLANEPDNWEVINIPAINEDNQSYWPERWPVEKLLEIKNTIGSYEFSALYQQTPTPRNEGMFQRQWFEIVDATPAKLTYVRGWDRAASVPKNGSDPDWTVGIKMGKSKDGVFYIADMVRFRGSSLEVQNAIQNTAARDGYLCKIVLEQDPGQAGKSEAEYLIRLLQGYNVRAEKVSKDKVTRAGPLSAQCEAGNVKILRAPWNEALLSELELFPFGSKHDDIIDSLSCSFNALCSPTLNYEALTML